MPCWSRSVVFLACACIHSVALAGARNCNVQCMFYYSGYEGCKNVEGFKWESFLETPVYPTTHEELFPSLKEFRTLNLKLCRLECFAANSDGVNVSNAVEETSRFLEDMARGPGEGFIDRALESVAFSIVRIQQRRSGLLLDIPAIERLLPDHLLEGDDMPMSLKTFKRMVIIARLVEKYRAEHWSLPVVLDEAGIPERYRKCAYGRDIEYDQYNGVWSLKCACESWSGGLPFDEYLPCLLSGSKKMPLVLSSSFSEKRKALYSGEWVFSTDSRLECRVDHETRGGTNGVHGIVFKNPAAGNGRIIKTTEIHGADSVSDPSSR